MVRSKTFKAVGVAAAIALAPMAASAVTVSNTTDTFNVLTFENGSAVIPNAGPTVLSLDTGDSFDFIGIANDGTGTKSGTGFMASQTFINNSGADSVFAAETVLLASEVVGAYLYAVVGGTIYDLGIGSTFKVAQGQNFAIQWGAADVLSTATYNVTVSAVPLPAAGLMLLTGLGGLGLARRKRKTA